MARQRTCNLPYEANQYKCATLAQPIKAASLSGFVNVFLVGQKRYIGVGNKSSPFFNNRCFITQMAFGGASSAEAQITIVDTSGNDLNVFLNTMYKDSCQDINSTACYLEFGWIATRIDGGTDIYSTARSERSVYADPGIPRTPFGLMVFNLLQLEVVSESSNCWKYTLTLKAMGDAKIRDRIATPIGTDDQKVPLKLAGRELWKRSCRRKDKRIRGDVYFFRNNETHFEPYGFLNSEGGQLGPRTTWDATRKNPIQALRQWMNSVVTDRRLGTTFYTDVTIEEPNLIALEGDDLACRNGQDTTCSGGNQPSLIYLVNAGDCSPVIDFKPKVSYKATAGSQGGGASAVSGRTAQARQCRDRRDNRGRQSTQGITTHITVPQNALNFRSPTNALQSEAFALGANFVANSTAMTGTPVEAELTIQGDVRYVSLAKRLGKTVGVIYMNNPAIRSFTSQAENVTCDWLAYPVVNSIFSSTQYWIQGVSHSINENGDFQTTLQLNTSMPANADGTKQTT